jgi:ABC-type transport system involved in multi-copper enzyme maturation permease subunit
MIGLIRSELLKIRTTNIWWLFALGVAGLTGLTLLFNCVQAHFFLNEELSTEGMDADEAAQIRAQSQVVAQAANVFTSGQYFGGLMVLLLAMIVVTNEFYHQTATATFLTTPHRSAVVAAKLVAAIGFAVGFWLITAVLSLVTGVVFFNAEGFPNHLGDWEVQRAILFNLLVFALWAVLGVGFGALIRNQIGAVVTGALLYVVGTQLAQVVFFLVREFLIKEDWVLTAQVALPAVAAQVFVSAVDAFPHSPPYWVGGLVMLGYGIVAGAVGTYLMRRRDIS